MNNVLDTSTEGPLTLDEAEPFALGRTLMKNPTTRQRRLQHR